MNFRRTIGRQDVNDEALLLLVEAYVNARTVQMGLQLAVALICWLVCHSVVVYVVFGNSSPAARIGAMLIEELATDESES
jgi:hypothetical protein